MPNSKYSSSNPNHSTPDYYIPGTAKSNGSISDLYNLPIPKCRECKFFEPHPSSEVLGVCKGRKEYNPNTGEFKTLRCTVFREALSPSWCPKKQ